MKYFNPSYWFKLWVLSAPLFNDKTQGINAKSIDNKKIKDWASNNTSLDLINQEINFTNSSTNYQPYNLNQVSNQNINPIYQTELEATTHKHRHEKSRNRHKRQHLHDEVISIIKKNENEQIDFVNENFFYNFNLNYDSGSITGTITSGWKNEIFSNVAIKNWTEYANNWDEFVIKFPEIELINLRTTLGGNGQTVEKNLNKFKFYTNAICNKTCVNDVHYSDELKTDHLLKSTLASHVSYNALLNQYYNNFPFQESYIFIRIYPKNEKLIIQNIFQFHSVTAFIRTFGSLKYDKIRLVGPIDLNPLISLLITRAQTIDNWHKSAMNTISLKEKNPNYSQILLNSEKNTIEQDLKDRLTDWQHSYFLTLQVISNNNDIISLRTEINKIKTEIERLKKREACLDTIIDAFRKNPTTTFDKTIDSIADKNSLNVIVKETIKSFSTSFIKGPVSGMLQCLFSSIFNSRKRREIFDINNDINNLEEKNVTKWNDNFTKFINHEQHLAIDSNNFVSNNITSL